MTLKEKIVDYNLHTEEVERWIALKGEKKYLEFASILEQLHIEITWDNLKDIYKYDKRLLVNCFKYLSFYEEFLRAQIWNVSQSSYSQVEKQYISVAMETVVSLGTKIQYQEFNLQALQENKQYINYLRNRVTHNKIVLNSNKENKSIRELLLAFKDCLPESYKEGFVSDINSCCKGLNIDEKLIINMN